MTFNYYSFTFGVTPWVAFDAVNVSAAIGLLDWEAEDEWQLMEPLLQRVRIQQPQAEQRRSGHTLL